MPPRPKTIAECFWPKVKLADAPRPGMDTPCLEWQGYSDRDGYGTFESGYKTVRAHRVAWELAHGPIPDGLHVLHKCDNPPCVQDEHLFLGTEADNAADRDAKGRQASGDRNGARLHPERMPRGEAHGARLHPECLSRGDSHYSRLHPERLARGDRSGSRLHPERLARGEAHYNAKLTAGNVWCIFQLRAQGWTKTKLAAEFGVGQSQIGRILARKSWSHVDAEGSQ